MFEDTLAAFQAWYDSLSGEELFWIILGFCAQFLFMMRFLVQWIYSEKARRSGVHRRPGAGADHLRPQHLFHLAGEAAWTRKPRRRRSPLTRRRIPGCRPGLSGSRRGLWSS